MRTILLIAFSIFVLHFVKAQTVVFSDNFESGTSAWTLTNVWGTSIVQSHSPTHALTESPIGTYTDDQLSYATMTNGVNLSSALAATLSFWAIYNIEGGFDYMYLDVSSNGGVTWVNLDSWDDTSTVWTQYSYSLGGFVGQSNVKIRFRFFSDGAVNFDGMYIDDIVITSYSTDIAPPLIVYSPREYHEGRLYADTLTASIIDISGVAQAKLIYSVDGASNDTLNPAFINNTNFSFIIPQIQPGASVNYHIYAKDSTTAGNDIATSIYNFIAGKHTFYDNGQVDFVDSISVGSGAAMKMTIAGPTTIAAVLLRNYTDVNRPNDSILVHIWTSASGVPGTDIITPIKVFPSATLTQTSAMTIVDLRPYANQLAGLNGDVFIGYTVPSGVAWATITQPSTISRSYKLASGSWSLATGTSGTSDFHFRIVTAVPALPPDANYTYNLSNDPTVSFTNLSTNAISYRWNFNDGTPFDTNANVNHTFAHDGSFNVCLKATNANGSDSVCMLIPISGNPAPVSDFSFDISADPTVTFTDLSTNNPTTWYWDFNDNGASSNLQNPSHTYPAIGGTFNVCMTASSVNGNGTTVCKNIVLSVGQSIGENGPDELIKIFPNPTTDQAFIELLNKNNSIIQLELFDNTGKLLEADYQVNSNGILLKKGKLSSGNYIFRIQIESGNYYTGHLIIR
ncbi:MAG: PKD domain-containing protein [Bacteroidales bacterium]|nr:PKD domain-containing protein [Bacteroidales bacterium]